MLIDRVLRLQVAIGTLLSSSAVGCAVAVGVIIAVGALLSDDAVVGRGLRLVARLRLVGGDNTLLSGSATVGDWLRFAVGDWLMS